MARWQHEQLDSLLDNLPLKHVVCVHDYSEGYACRSQDEIQSEYFDVAKVSLHITILHRHAVEAIDGVKRTEENPHLIKEHIFISGSCARSRQCAYMPGSNSKVFA